MEMHPDHKSINIAIIAMGGQGGGVLSKWILDLADSQGYLAQYTSVPGVAQRTGSTIYYIEIFPAHLAEKTGKKPIFALTPVPGDVDIVIASEMIEAGRALLRGFVDDKTVFIASDHRDFTIAEKQEMGDGRRTVSEIQEASKKIAKQFVCFDMDEAARTAGSVVSSVLFGALAGSAALPFKKHAYETTIKETNKAVDANLGGFELGYQKAAGEKRGEDSIKPSPTSNPIKENNGLPILMDRMEAEFPAHSHYFITEGLKAVVDYQGVQYADVYLDRLTRIRDCDEKNGGKTKRWQLTNQTARYLALAMTYDDIIRVADLKTRSERFSEFRGVVKAEDGQIVNVSEFMHPRLQEICEILPRRLGEFVLNNSLLSKALGRLFTKGRRITTTKLPGFLLLYLLGRTSWLRSSSWRMETENNRIDRWLSAISTAAQSDYDAAIELAGLQRLIKGYGDTHERGLRNYNLIFTAYRNMIKSRENAQNLKRLKEAALQDENGRALSLALNDIVAS